MLLQKLQTLTEIEGILNSELKRVRAELKQLKTKQAKLNQWLELQNQLLSDPDVADTLVGGAQTPEAPRLIEIDDSDPDDEAADSLNPEPAIATPEQEEKVREAAAKLTVIWEGAAMGKTIDAEGVERRFYVKKWDAFRLGFILETSSGKAIESHWKNAGIANNSHFLAIKRSQHEQFLKECKKFGVDLSLIESDNVSRSYSVCRLPDSYNPDERLGTITQSFDELWHIGNGRFHPRKYAHIHDCLAALKIEIEAKQAKADIGF